MIKVESCVQLELLISFDVVRQARERLALHAVKQRNLLESALSADEAKEQIVVPSTDRAGAVNKRVVDFFHYGFIHDGIASGENLGTRRYGFGLRWKW